MTISQDLFELADAAATGLKRAREGAFAHMLKTLDKVSHAAGRAWSGSNIGYHATVYYESIRPKPPGVQFSPEWGLENAWPSYEPDPGWIDMDQDAVVDELLARAKIQDITAIEQLMKELRDLLSELKEQSISALDATLSQRDDGFVRRQLRAIEDLKVAAPNTIALTMLPKQYWSRDSTAMAQGLRVAPHQRLIAICLSETVTENGLATLEQAVRLSAVHLQRLGNMDRSSKLAGKHVFIGHGASPAWRDLKDFISERLHLPYDEFNRVSVAGVPNTIRLGQMLDAAGIAFVVLTGEDEQADGKIRARMNVIHETGLFQGRLGFTKGIVLLEEGCEEFSNIEGLGQIRFPKGNIRSAFEEIRLVLEREGLVEPSSH